MAGVHTKIKDVSQIGLKEFVCDKVEEVEDAPTTTEKGKSVFSHCKYYAPMEAML